MEITFGILAATIAMFIWGKLRPDITALLSMLALYLSGIINLGQTLGGFADSAVILIAALFVVGEGLTHTGITSWLGARMMALSQRKPILLMLWMMGFGAVVSGFMSNTAAVAALMPAVVAAAWGVGSVPAKFLMPLSFAAITGGLLTLMGTPPNIVASETLTAAGYAPIGFFDFAVVGVPLVAAVMVYMVTLGQRLLPDHASGVKPIDIRASMGEFADSYSLHGKLFRLRVRQQSSLAGMTLAESALGRDYEITVMRVEHDATEESNVKSERRLTSRIPLDRLRHADEVVIPSGKTLLNVNDVLLVRSTPELIKRAQLIFNFGVQPVDEDAEPLTGTLLSREVGLAEVLVTPRCELIGQTLAESRFADRYNVHVIGVRRHDQIAKRQRVKLDFGDSLLVRGKWDAIRQLAADQRNFVVVGSPDAMAEQVSSLSRNAWVALGAVAVMVTLMVSGAVPSVMAALIAVMIMLLGGAVPVDQLYKAISWPSIILIAAMIPMSTALQVSGGAAYLVDGLVQTLGTMSPWVLLAGIFLITSALSQVISNTATTVLVAPLALQAALSLGISPYPLMMMVVVGASTAFLTPIGTPTNLLVMAPGGYQFRHYAIVGLPIYLVFLAVALLVVPLVWPI